MLFELLLAFSTSTDISLQTIAKFSRRQNHKIPQNLLDIFKTMKVSHVGSVVQLRVTPGFLLLTYLTLRYKKFQRNFTSPDEGHKMTLVGRCKITDGMKITDIS